MELRKDLLNHLTTDDIAEEAAQTAHLYNPEPHLSKTGVGSLSPASTEERAREEAHSTELTRKL